MQVAATAVRCQNSWELAWNLLCDLGVGNRFVANIDLEAMHRKRQLGCDDFITGFEAVTVYQYELPAITVLVTQFFDSDGDIVHRQCVLSAVLLFGAFCLVLSHQ